MKILLIEDRIERKKQFIEASGISDLSIYPFLKELTPEEVKLIKDNLNSEAIAELRKYDLILLHKSAFTINQQDMLNSVGKPIVYFSGGISHSFYIDLPYPCLHMNSKEFYSSKLIEFLNRAKEFDEIELLILQFGKNWKLNLLLNTKDKLSQILYKNKSADLYPEDFEGIFNKKVTSLITSDTLKSELDYIQTNGLRSTELEKINPFLNELDFSIRNQIGLIV